MSAATIFTTSSSPKRLAGRRSRGGRLLFLWLACGLGLSCQEAPEAVSYRTTHQLTHELATAELTTEIEQIVMGQAAGRAFLRQGFSADEFEQRLERPYVWGVGESSEINLPILRRRDAVLLLEVRPYVFPEAPPQTLDVSLNGFPIAHFELQRRVETYHLPIPASAQQLGDNRLRFEHGWHRRPSESGGLPTDRRELATAFFTLRWQQPSPAAHTKPSVDVESSRLFLPQGTRLDLYLALNGASRLWADQWSFRGSNSRLRLTLQEEGQSPHVIADLDDPPDADAVPLPGQGHRLVRLRIESLAREDSTAPLDPEHGVLWLQPRIEDAEGSVEAIAPTPADASTIAEVDASERHSENPLPNIIIYMIDTLRADHLGCYGYGRPTSPHLDAFAEEAVLFENATAQSSWTRSSVASLMTGLWPVAHGTNLRDDVLHDDAVTLQESMQRRGYRTAAFLSNPNVSQQFGFHQGFDHLVDLGNVDTDGTDLNRLAFQWLEENAEQGPFLLYIHTIDPHSPYDPPAEYRQRFAPQISPEIAWTPVRLPRAVRRRRAQATAEQMAEMVDLYDAEIAFNDAAFGELRNYLESRNLFESSMVMVLSDHGEEFFEHGYLEHGKNLFVETLHIPWIIKPPGRPGEDFETRRVSEVVQHIDLFPTLRRLLDLDTPDEFLGRDLSPLWLASQELEESDVYSYLHLDGTQRISLIEGDWKLVQRLAADDRLVQPHLYHLSNDPREREDLAATHTIRQRYMSKLMRRRLSSPEGRLETTKTVIDDTLRQRLEALGYLQ